MELINEISDKISLPIDAWLINLDDFESHELISKSKKKQIYQIIEKSTNKVYAAEIFNITTNTYSKFEESNLQRLLQIQFQQNYISILKIKGFSPINFNHKSNPVLITEFASNGNLSDFLDSAQKNPNIPSLLSQTKKLINIFGIASGMKHLHSQDIIHRQLQTSSILLDEFLYPKISKFDNCTKMANMPLSNKSDTFTEPQFVAPEIWESNKYSKSSDVYAFSMIVYEIMTNKRQQPKSLKKKKFIDKVINQNWRPELPPSIPKCYKDLIESCWSKNPEDRPTFSDILTELTTNSEFFSDEIDGVEYLQYIENSGQLINDDPDKLFDENLEKTQIDMSQYEIFKETNNYYYYKCIKNVKTNELFIAEDYQHHIYMNFTDEQIKMRRRSIIKIMSEIDHPAIAKYYGYSLIDFKNNNNMMVVIENASNGKLYNILKSRKSGYAPYRWDDTKMLINFYGIASAMEYLHSKNIIHRHLTLLSVYEDSYLYPKLANFEFAFDLNSKMEQFEDSPFGNSNYLPIEVFTELKYSKKSDVFAFGILLYLFFSRDFNAYDVIFHTEVMAKVLKGEHPKFYFPIPIFYRNLIEMCLDDDAEKRPSFSEIVELLKTKEAVNEKVNKKEFWNYVNYIEKKDDSLIKDLSQIILYDEKEPENKKCNINSLEINTSFLINLKNFNVLFCIGSGGFSDVYTIENTISKEIYVAKIINKFDVNSFEKLKLYFSREINIMSQLNHPCLINFIGYSQSDFEGKPHPTIIMEYATNGTLYDVLKLEDMSCAPSEWNDTKKLINLYGIASAMKYMHSLDIINRDLKPANVLEDDYLFPKLTDFGLSKQLNQEYSNNKNYSNEGLVGTYLYMAPEVLRNGEYSKKSDVYSFAFIAFQVFNLDSISKLNKLNLFDIFRMTEMNSRPEFNCSIPTFYKELIERCWSQYPEDRPTFSEIVDLLKSDKALTDNIDKDEFMDYVDYIDSYNFKSNEAYKFVSFQEFINNKNIPFLQGPKFESFTNLPTIKKFNKVKVNYDAIKKTKELVISVSIPKFDLDKYQQKDSLGSGSYGEAYKIKNKETNEIYAAKILHKTIESLNDCDRLSVLREVTILPKMKYESIIKFVGYSLVDFDKEERPVFITELAVNGSLGNLLKLERKGRTITGWNDTKRLINIYGIACGMEYLHYNSIIHRDLKPDNILLDENLYPKITDFGLSRFSKHNFDKISEHWSNVLGTLPYVSPEIWNCDDHSTASDVYAFGITVYEIITKEEPLKHFTSVFQIRKEVLSNQYRPKFESPIPECYKKLIEKCWCHDKLQRPSFAEIIYELKNNKEFITGDIDLDEFVQYTKLIGEPYPTLNSEDQIESTAMNKKEKVGIHIPNTIKEISEITISTFDRIIEKEKKESHFEKCFLDLDRFEQTKLIAKNEFDRIFEVVEKKTNKKYSARVSNIDMNQFSEREMISISNEMMSISRIHHPCILKFIGFSPKSFKNEPKPVIINKLVNTKTLKDILKRVREKETILGWNLTTKLKVIYGLASAMNLLHSNNILHRNLTPSSILLTKSFNPKLSEFGLCTHLLIKNSATFQSARQFNVSPIYSAPEILNSYDNTKKSDIYSFGLIVYEILSGNKPFNEIKNFSYLYESVMRGCRPPFPENMPEIYQKFIECCWSQNPDERPQFEDILGILKSDDGFFLDDIDKDSFFKYVRKIDDGKDPDHHGHKKHKKNQDKK